MGIKSFEQNYFESIPINLTCKFDRIYVDCNNYYMYFFQNQNFFLEKLNFEKAFEDILTSFDHERDFSLLFVRYILSRILPFKSEQGIIELIFDSDCSRKLLKWPTCLSRRYLSNNRIDYGPMIDNLPQKVFLKVADYDADNEIFNMVSDDINNKLLAINEFIYNNSKIQLSNIAIFSGDTDFLCFFPNKTDCCVLNIFEDRLNDAAYSASFNKIPQNFYDSEDKLYNSEKMICDSINDQGHHNYSYEKKDLREPNKITFGINLRNFNCTVIKKINEKIVNDEKNTDVTNVKSSYKNNSSILPLTSFVQNSNLKRTDSNDKLPFQIKRRKTFIRKDDIIYNMDSNTLLKKFKGKENLVDFTIKIIGMTSPNDYITSNFWDGQILKNVLENYSCKEYSLEYCSKNHDLYRKLATLYVGEYMKKYKNRKELISNSLRLLSYDGDSFYLYDFISNQHFIDENHYLHLIEKLKDILHNFKYQNVKRNELIFKNLDKQKIKKILVKNFLQSYCDIMSNLNNNVYSKEIAHIKEDMLNDFKIVSSCSILLLFTNLINTFFLNVNNDSFAIQIYYLANHLGICSKKNKDVYNTFLINLLEYFKCRSYKRIKFFKISRNNTYKIFFTKRV